MKILFIVNPCANGGITRNYKSKIERYMAHKGYKNYEIVMTKKSGHATEIAYSNAEEYDVLVAVGGDGTIKEVAEGIVKKGKGVLGIIAAGTGNDFVYGLGLEKELEKAIDRIFEFNVKTVDVGLVNGQIFLNIATIGFDAYVVKETEKWKKKLKSRLAYRVGIISALFRYKGIHMNIIGGDREETCKILLLAVGVGKQYGGGFPILPDAIFDDGLFDVCRIKNMNKLNIIKFLPTLVKGLHKKQKKFVDMYRTDKLIVNVADDMYLNMDGEISRISKNDTIEFSLINNGIDVII